jgi:tRNA(Ile)-lysidine synthase
MRHGLATLVGVVQRSIRQQAMVGAGDRVLVAVSGGADSVGLLLVLSALRRRLGVALVAAHVHHGLRGAEADADQACAAAAAEKLGVPFVHAAIGDRLAGRASNLEARARIQRYAALRSLAAVQGCNRIATGHTLDDQAETVLMRIVRGSGLRGLAAIRPRRRDGVVRPLIDCRRAALRAAVEQAGLAYRHDASNDDPRFLRTQVRARLLPLLAELNPAIVEACAGLASASRAERAAAARWADGALEVAAADGRLPVAWLGQHPDGLRRLLLRRWLVRGGVPRRRLSRRHVQAAVDLALAVAGRGEVHLPIGWTLRRSRGRLALERHKSTQRRTVASVEKPL